MCELGAGGFVFINKFLFFFSKNTTIKTLVVTKKEGSIILLDVSMFIKYLTNLYLKKKSEPIRKITNLSADNFNYFMVLARGVARFS